MNNKKNSLTYWDITRVFLVSRVMCRVSANFMIVARSVITKKEKSQVVFY